MKLEILKKIKKEEKGITLTTLIIAIILMLIIAGIAVYNGKGTIKEANLQDIKTNMLLIRAKCKEYVEQTNFEIGNETDETKIEEIKQKNLKGKSINEIIDTSIENLKTKEIIDTSKLEQYYVLEQSDLHDIGINQIKSEEGNYYIVKYDIENLEVDVINTKGYKHTNSNMYYTLTQLEEL